MEEKIIDCTGFNFHCPEDRNYLIFDPQSQEENDRLDQLLGATALWKASIEKKRQKLQPDNRKWIAPFCELHPVGYTPTGEAIGIVLGGALVNNRGQVEISGQWFGVRISAGGETQLVEDLNAEVQERKQRLVAEFPPGSIRID